MVRRTTGSSSVANSTRTRRRWPRPDSDVWCGATGHGRFVVELAAQGHRHGAARRPLVGALAQLEHGIVREGFSHAAQYRTPSDRSGGGTR